LGLRQEKKVQIGAHTTLTLMNKFSIGKLSHKSSETSSNIKTVFTQNATMPTFGGISTFKTLRWVGVIFNFYLDWSKYDTT
jgi:hypothetical protein